MFGGKYQNKKIQSFLLKGLEHFSLGLLIVNCFKMVVNPFTPMSSHSPPFPNPTAREISPYFYPIVWCSQKKKKKKKKNHLNTNSSNLLN